MPKQIYEEKLNERFCIALTSTQHKKLLLHCAEKKIYKSFFIRNLICKKLKI